CGRILQAGVIALWRAPHEGQEPTLREMQAAVDAMLTARQSVVPPLFGLLMASSLVHQQEYGMLMMAGWARTQISRKKALRLQEQLRQELATRGAQENRTEDLLLELLLSNTFTAWQEYGPHDLARLRTRIAYLVEHELSDQSSQAILQPREDPTRNDPTYEAVARKIEEEDLYAARFRQAQLTPFEEAVTRLQLQEYSDQEIADRLEKSLGAIQQAWWRARNKLQPVMGS